MFLNIDQQLARCERVIRQRVRPHIHRTIEPLSIEAFDIPGEPMPATDFFVHESKGAIPTVRCRFRMGNHLGYHLVSAERKTANGISEKQALGTVY